MEAELQYTTGVLWDFMTQSHRRNIVLNQRLIGRWDRDIFDGSCVFPSTTTFAVSKTFPHHASLDVGKATDVPYLWFLKIST